MANLIRQVLPFDGETLTIACAGMKKVGVGISGGPFAGTVSFFASTDGVNFVAVNCQNYPADGSLSTGQMAKSATQTGNWDFDVTNHTAFRVVFSRTSGTVTISLGTSVDESYAIAFLAATSVFVNKEQTGGSALTLTQAANANRGWRLRTLTGSFSAAPASPVKVTINDGASAVLWVAHVAAAAGPFQVTLPLDDNEPTTSGGGVYNTPGNSMVITTGAPGGGITTELNAEFIPC